MAFHQHCVCIIFLHYIINKSFSLNTNLITLTIIRLNLKLSNLDEKSKSESRECEFGPRARATVRVEAWTGVGAGAWARAGEWERARARQSVSYREGERRLLFYDPKGERRRFCGYDPERGTIFFLLLSIFFYFVKFKTPTVGFQ